jgi:hypothetical protein
MNPTIIAILGPGLEPTARRKLYDPAVVKAQGLEYTPIGRKP